MLEETAVLAEIEASQGTTIKTVFLQTTLLDNGTSGMKLVLTDGEDLWKGEISEDDLQKLSTRLKMDFKKFVDQSVSALTRDRLQDITYEYHLKALPAGRMQLVWKKSIAEDNVKFQLGQVNLEKSDSSSHSLNNLLSQSVKVISTLKEQIRNLETYNQRLERDRISAIKRLEKCVTAKADLESDLFSKFVAILNSKKEKIRELEEENYSAVTRDKSSVAGSSSANVDHEASTSACRNGRQLTKTTNSAPYAADTDDEIEPPPTKQKKSAIDLQDSINLGDDDDEEPVPVTRRPKRKSPAKKTSISKPVLPRVTSSPSIERPNSAGRRSSLRKSGSGNSRSSENVDDLLDQM